MADVWKIVVHPTLSVIEQILVIRYLLLLLALATTLLVSSLAAPYAISGAGPIHIRVN